MRSEIVLIGPSRVGKTTVATLLAEQLGLEAVHLDHIRRPIMAEIGYDQQLDHTIRQQGGFLARRLYWQLFDAYVVEQVLARHQNCVFDFGAGHSVFDSDELLNRVATALAPFANVFLLLPSADPTTSIRILNQRLAQEPVNFNFDFTTHFINHKSNYQLARYIVYTEGKPFELIRDEILAHCDTL